MLSLFTSRRPISGRGLTAASFAALALASGVSQAASPNPADLPYAADRVLIQPRAGLSLAEIDKAIAPHGGKRGRFIAGAGVHVIQLPPGADPKAVAAALSKHPHLKFAEVDMKLKHALAVNDPYYANEWHLNTINAPTAWNSSTAKSMTIAILDTGVDGTHPDLSAQMVPGWNFYNNSSNTADSNGHGTEVAGTAAALGNNSIGVASPAFNAKIMPVVIADSTGTAYLSTIAQGLTWAANNGANVANISYDAVAGYSTVQSAAQYFQGKGGVTVGAAGNDSANLTFASTTTMVTAAATDSSNNHTSWSNYGNLVSIAAPGVGIYTTTNGGGYGAPSGTSFSSPIVAGVVAQMKSARPDLSSTTIQSLLFSSATDLGTAGWDMYYGWGLVNAAAAVQAAIAAPTTVLPPTVAITSPTGSTVSGLVPVNVTAASGIGIAHVDLSVNGVQVATDNISPYAYSWDSTKTANGTAQLTAYAYDTAGNYTKSGTVSINVSNAVAADTTPPTVAFTSPTGGATVNGNVNVATSASDNSGPTGISQSLYIDGALKASASGATLSYSWNTRKVASGPHTLTVTARDAAGNASSTSVTVTR